MYGSGFSNYPSPMRTPENYYDEKQVEMFYNNFVLSTDEEAYLHNNHLMNQGLFNVDNVSTAPSESLNTQSKEDSHEDISPVDKSEELSNVKVANIKSVEPIKRK